MAIKEVAGVLSRYFVVGFLLPAVFALIVLGQLVSDELLPQVYERHKEGTRLLVLGGVGLFVGLLLSGIHEQVLRLFSGYPLSDHRERRWLRGLHRIAVARWEKEFDALTTVRDGSIRSPERTRAAQQLERSYPPARQDLLPTRFGNVVLAFERHARKRWALDGVVVGPRIELLLGAEQLEVRSAARTDVAFFLNGALASIAAGGILIVDEIVNGAGLAPVLAMYLIAFLVAAGFYRASVNAAVRWGSYERSIVDLYHLDLYRRLGVRLPRTVAEQTEIARAVSRCLLYGEPLPDDVRELQPTEGTP